MPLPVAIRFEAAVHANSAAHLSGIDELKRAKSGLQVGGVGLEVVKSTSNAELELRWA